MAKIIVYVDGVPHRLVPLAKSLGETPVSALKASLRLQDFFKNNNIEFLEQVLKWTEVRFLREPNCGRKALNELKELVQKYLPGCYLGMLEERGDV